MKKPSEEQIKVEANVANQNFDDELNAMEEYPDLCQADNFREGFEQGAKSPEAKEYWFKQFQEEKIIEIVKADEADKLYDPLHTDNVIEKVKDLKSHYAELIKVADIAIHREKGQYETREHFQIRIDNLNMQKQLYYGFYQQLNAIIEKP